MLNMDLNILNSLQYMKNPVMDKVMVFITMLGNNAMIWVLIVLILMMKKKYRIFGSFILLGLGVGLLAGNVALKNIIARPRPCWGNSQITLLIVNPTDFSFPSGHTLHSFIAATMLMIQDKRWGIPALLLAGGIGFSRLYLYVHYPTDVIGGAIIGILIGIVMTWLYRKKVIVKGYRKKVTVKQEEKGDAIP